MSQPSAPPRPGAMTAAMSTVPLPGAIRKVLRVGVIEHAALTEERVFRDRVAITAGRTERCTLTVRDAGFPEHIELFTVRDGGYALRMREGMEGRVALDDGLHTLDECMQGATPHQRDGWLTLSDTARGRITFAGVTFLFQFVPAPPDAVRPQLPASLRRGVSGSVDWRYSACLAGFMSLAVGGLGWVEYVYDPEVPTDTEIIELVANHVRLAPQPEDEPAPPVAPVADNSEAASAETPAHPQQHPEHPASTSPRSNDTASADRAVRSADLAVASAIHAMDLHWAPLTGLTDGHRSAVDQLASNALMSGTEDDLRNTHGITSDAPGIHGASGSLVPGMPGHHLGQTTLVASNGDRVTSGHVGEEHAPHSTLTAHLPEPPTTDTCSGDASGVARTIRGQLGGLRSCYERVSRNNPDLAGRVMLRFTVGSSGRATTVTVDGMNSDIDQCLESAVHRLVFPVPACGVAGYEYPVVFDHAGM